MQKKGEFFCFLHNKMQWPKPQRNSKSKVEVYEWRSLPYTKKGLGEVPAEGD